MSTPQPQTRTMSLTLHDLAKMIDHSLLHPTMTDSDLASGLALCKKYNVASACIKPYAIPLARSILGATSTVAICAVIGFPHGNSTTAIKVLEAEQAAAAGATEIDMVINIGKALGGDWEYVREEIRVVNEAVVARGAVLKVIFENDYLGEEEIVRLCGVCSDLEVAFVKTSTGYGFVKQANGDYAYKGATAAHLKLMRANCDPKVQIKAAGGVRTLDDLLNVMALGVTRIGATATAIMLEDAKKRGFSEVKKEVKIEVSDSLGGGY